MSDCTLYVQFRQDELKLNMILVNVKILEWEMWDNTLILLKLFHK